MKRRRPRQVLECASLLTLWQRGRADRKRQRTGAVQDATAQSAGPWSQCMRISWPSGWFFPSTKKHPGCFVKRPRPNNADYKRKNLGFDPQGARHNSSLPHKWRRSVARWNAALMRQKRCQKRIVLRPDPHHPAIIPGSTVSSNSKAAPTRMRVTTVAMLGY